MHHVSQVQSPDIFSLGYRIGPVGKRSREHVRITWNPCTVPAAMRRVPFVWRAWGWLQAHVVFTDRSPTRARSA